MSNIKISLVPKNRLHLYGRWCMISKMDTNDVKKLTGFNDDQLDYLLKKIDVLKREKAQGKAREYSLNDITILMMIAKLREKKIAIREINKILNTINKNHDKAATIAVYPVKNKKPLVSLKLHATNKDLVATLDDHIYNDQEAKPELWLLADGAWVDGEPMYQDTVNLTNEDQLTFEFKHEEGV